MLKLKPDDPTHIGPYTIVGVIGEGGMGRVYLGHNNGKLAAVKVMTEIYANVPAFRTRFRREMEVVKKIDPGFIAQILGFGVMDGRLWCASEYVPGPTLAEAVHTARFSGDALVQLAYSLCKALAPIHRAGVVHRDFKPANIILGENGVKVVDFGIAADEDAPALTMTGELLGTPSYMAPEQVVGGKPTPTWDVFAFGSVIAFAATGRPPYTGSNRAAIMVAIANPSTQPDLSGVPANLRPLIASCLQHDPAKRPTLEEIERRLPHVRTAAAASTAWMPQPVTAKVQEATRVMTQLKADLAPTRKDPRPGPVPAPKPVPPVPQKRSHTWLLVWVGAVAAIAIALGLAGKFDGEDSPGATPKASQPATVEVPLPTFTGSKLNSTGNMAVTKVATDERQLHLTIAFNGDAEARKAAVAQSCLKVAYSENSHVVFKPDEPNEDTPSDVVEFRSALDFSGKAYFFAKCPKYGSIKGGQLLGSNKVPNDGYFGDEESLLPVIDAYPKDGKLKVVLRDYSTYDAARYKAMCLKTDDGLQRVASLTEAVNRDRSYVVLTYNATRGTIYLKCSGSQKISYTGKGVAIP